MTRIAELDGIGCLDTLLTRLFSIPGRSSLPRIQLERVPHPAIMSAGRSQAPSYTASPLLKYDIWAREGLGRIRYGKGVCHCQTSGEMGK